VQVGDPISRGIPADVARAILGHLHLDEAVAPAGERLDHLEPVCDVSRREFDLGADRESAAGLTVLHYVVE
jgi:hypothetical protein